MRSTNSKITGRCSHESMAPTGVTTSKAIWDLCRSVAVWKAISKLGETGVCEGSVSVVRIEQPQAQKHFGCSHRIGLRSPTFIVAHRSCDLPLVLVHAPEPKIGVPDTR